MNAILCNVSLVIEVLYCQCANHSQDNERYAVFKVFQKNFEKRAPYDGMVFCFWTHQSICNNKQSDSSVHQTVAGVFGFRKSSRENWKVHCEDTDGSEEEDHRSEIGDDGDFVR